ncbi:MAG TPA: hypothetical protein VGE41_02630 [Verrucomicrobiae bacterium]
MKPFFETLLHHASFALLSLLCITPKCQADEKLAVLRVGSDVYSNVTVTAVTATDIYFTYNKGVFNAKLKNLDATMQNHFHYDAAASALAAAKPAGVPALAPAAGPSTTPTVIDRSNAQTVMDESVSKVKAIINQPVRQLPRTPEMQVSVYSPGWYHPGAIKPEFKTVDIRPTQSCLNDNNPYITSDLNPGVVFAGPETEFNSMTKYFYTDRALPKKKLTEAEMLEINRLYRIIGDCEEKLKAPTVLAMDFITQYKNKLVIAAIALGLLLLPLRMLMSRRACAE